MTNKRILTAILTLTAGIASVSPGLSQQFNYPASPSTSFNLLPSAPPAISPPIVTSPPSVPLAAVVSPSPIETISTTETIVPAQRFYAGSDYLLWWMKQPGQSAPLVTTGNPMADNPGAVGDPATQGLLGPGGLHYPLLSGVRGRVGAWLDGDQKTNLEFSGFWLQQAQAHYQFSSDLTGNPLLANPLTFSSPGLAPYSGTNLITYPGGYAGGVSVLNSTSLWGAEVDLGRTIYEYHQGCWQANIRGLVGFRYLNLQDTLSITTTSSVNADSILPLFYLGNAINPPATLGTLDRISASNHFYGGQLGLASQGSFGHWSVGVTGKIAFGPNQELITVQGNSALYQPGMAPIPAVGGIYAQPSNIGRYRSTVFDVVPEVEAKLAYRLGNHTQLSVGYNFLYFNHIARAAEQIDVRSDTAQIPSGNPFYVPGSVGQYPQMPFHQTNLWAQGITFGCRLDF